MCTVSFIYKENKDFVLTSSRDESPMRATILPTVYEIVNTKMIFPKDTIAGGTWIGMSEKKRVVCLLNGGFQAHERLSKYRESRGVVVKDFLAADSIMETIKTYHLLQIEPFTLVIVDWNKKLQLLELVWDGTQKHLQKLPLTSHIWSSSSLYTEEMKQLRRNWFADFQQKNTLNVASILDFHKNAGIGDRHIDVLMDRGFVKTMSITQINKMKDTITMNYHALSANTKSTIVLNQAAITHE